MISKQNGILKSGPTWANLGQSGRCSSQPKGGGDFYLKVESNFQGIWNPLEPPVTELMLLRPLHSHHRHRAHTWTTDVLTREHTHVHTESAGARKAPRSEELGRRAPQSTSRAPQFAERLREFSPGACGNIFPSAADLL